MATTPKVTTTSGPSVLTAEQVAAASVEDVIAWLHSSPDGLSSAEAAARLSQYGPNAVRTHHVNALAVLGRQLNNAVLILLAATAVVSFFLGDSTQAVIIGVILAVSVGLGFRQRVPRRTGGGGAALRDPPQRGGAPRRRIRHQVDVTDLVPGDVIQLTLGEVVPADVRLLEVNRPGMQREHPDRRVDCRSEKSPQPVPAGAELAD